MRDQEIIGLQEAYASIYIQDDIVTEDAQQAVGKALDAAAKNPVIKAIGKVIAPVGKGRKTPTKTSDGYRAVKEDIDIFDVILEHLVAEGYADTNEAALAIMANMSEEWKQSIVEAPGEWFGGLRDKARASRAAQMQSSQPTPKPGPNVSSPFAKPASRTDSGKLTTYGAGGGSAAERAGQTRAQVMQQGAKNLETRNKSNPGPNFGR